MSFSTKPVEHSTRDSAVSTFKETVDNVVDGASWMGVMFEFIDGRVSVHRTTFNAPRHLLLPALELLREQLTAEARQPAFEPLPIAERFRMQLKSAADESDPADSEGE